VDQERQLVQRGFGVEAVLLTTALYGDEEGAFLDRGC
jgi:hypothetical protein